MRIALLGHEAAASPLGRQAQLLAGGLGATGVEVTTFFATATHGAESLAAARAFEQAAQFDLIHNWIGERALIAARLVSVPILTTLDHAPSDEFAQLCRALAGRAWFAAHGSAARGAGVDWLATVEPATRDAERFARDYAALYARVLDSDRRRRVDSGHDRRPWGEYRVLIDDARFKVKRIDVLPGKRLSYQRHRQRSEHWTVVLGCAVVTLDGARIELREGQSIDVPAGAAHRVENPGPGPLVFVEVQRGSYFGEDDIQRLEDDFGRA